VHRDKTIRLGSYKTIEEAAAAYDKAALEIYGPDAATNQKIIEDFLDKLKKCFR